MSDPQQTPEPDINQDMAPEAVNDAAPEPQAEPTPEERAQALEARVQELEAALLYARAETENTRKRARDEAEIIGKMRNGFEGVERFFVQRLEANGIQRKPAQGERFDPELHQAMSEAPAPEGVEPGTVLQAWSSAWTLNGRLLKPAMVVVAA